MSWLGLNEEDTMKAIGSADQTTIRAYNAPRSSIRGKRLSIDTCHPPVHLDQVIGGDQHRASYHDPAGRRGDAEIAEPETRLVQIDREHLGQPCRAALGEEPDFGEQPEREDQAED